MRIDRLSLRYYALVSTSYLVEWRVCDRILCWQVCLGSVDIQILRRKNGVGVSWHGDDRTPLCSREREGHGHKKTPLTGAVLGNSPFGAKCCNYPT